MEEIAKVVLENFMYGLIKEARRDSFMEFLESYGVTYEDYEEYIIPFFEENNINIK